jgi:hypothetical protein
MRYRIRRILFGSLVFLKSGTSIAPIFDPNNAVASSIHQHSHISAHHALEPRMGLHVRNGDSGNDGRGSIKIDRSFGKHMQCAGYLASRMGVRNLYLATDNVTLFSLAPELYPQYGWMAQQRTLQVFTGQSFKGYFNEKSVHQDVANIMVSELIWLKCFISEMLTTCFPG